MANGYIPAQVERSGCEPCSQVVVENKAFLGGVLGIDVNGERQPISEGGIVDLTFIETDIEQAAERVAQSAAEAEAAKEAAENASTAAYGSQMSAHTAATAAELAQEAAETAKTAAQVARAGAETAQTGAQAAQTAAQTAQTGAQSAQAAAESAATAAAGSATDASTSATAAAGSATQATTAATNAASSATAASGSASDAATSATAAGASATAASQSASDANAAKLASQTAQQLAEAAQAGAEAAESRIMDTVPDAVTDWLDDHVTQETGYVIDDSLTIQGAAADAKATGAAITQLNGAVYGEVDNTFPLTFEGGTYYSTATGQALEKYYGGGYDKTRKVVKTTTFNAPCDVVINAKTGYSFTVFTSANGIITGNSGLITSCRMLAGQQYGMTLRTTGGSDDISALDVSQIVDIEYIDNVSALQDAITFTEIPDCDQYQLNRYYISPSNNVWSVNDNVVGYMIPVPTYVKTITIDANESDNSFFAFLKTSVTRYNTAPQYATGYTSRITVIKNTTQIFEKPIDCLYIWVFGQNATATFKPDAIVYNCVINGKTLQNDVDYLISLQPNYSGKKLSILGDSISTFVPTADKVDGKAPTGCTTNYPGNPVQYENSSVTSVSSTWWGKVLSRFDMVLGINESWAGSTIGYNSNYTDSGKYTADNCMCSATRIGHLDENGTPDLIIVFGGTNDINHHLDGNNTRFAVGSLDTTHNPYDFDNFPMVTDTYYGAITTMLLRIQHEYPTATILMLLPYFCTYTHTSSGDIASPSDQNIWCNAAIDVCKFLGVEYLDLRTIINMYDVSTLLFDGLHPNATGMTAIAKAVIHKLNSML